MKTERLEIIDFFILLFVSSFCFWVGHMVGEDKAVTVLEPYLAPPRADTTYVLPDPMYVGNTLGLHCYIEMREPAPGDDR